MKTESKGYRQAFKFVECLYPDFPLTYQTFSERKSRLTDPQIFHGSIDQCWKDLRFFNSYDAGIYSTINQTDGNGRSIENITYITSLFLDLDGAPLDQVLSCPIYPNVVLESSPGRYQCRWKLNSIEVTPENRNERIALFRAAQIGLAKLFNGDTKVSDLGRVARIPGFYNHKRESPFLVKIVGLNETPAFDLHEFCAALQIDLSAKTLKLYSRSENFLNVHVNIDSDHPIYEGERNVSIFHICRNFAFRDVRGDDLIDLALAVNQSRCDPPLPEIEVERTANSVDKYFSEHNYLSPKNLARVIMDSYEENYVDLVFSDGKFYSYNYGRMSYEAVDIRKLYSRMWSISDLTRSKELLGKTLHELSKIARQGIPRDTLEYQFCRKCLIKSPVSKVTLSAVYQAYKKWCRQKGIDPASQSVLRKEIETRMEATLKRIRIGKSLHMGFDGIALKTR